MPDVVGLHGFTQRGSMWTETAAIAGGRWSTPDLPGHGGLPAPPSWEDAVAAVMEDVPSEAVLVGYSLGGRLALAGALARPVRALIVVSASPGIRDEVRRARRCEEDLAVAAGIETEGVEAFVDGWVDRPMFAGLAQRGDEWRAEDRARRAGHDAAGLAAVLRVLGQGTMPWLGAQLDRLRSIPTRFIAGSEDSVYVDHAEAMAGATHGELVVVPGAGHAVVGERPEAVAAVIRELL